MDRKAEGLSPAESEELLQHIDKALGVFERSRAPRTSADISVKSMLSVLRTEVLSRYLARGEDRDLVGRGERPR